MSNKNESNSQHKWLIKIFFITFILSLIFNSLSTEFVENLNIIWSILILVLVILTGIVSDLIATAVTAADETPFHAKAADKKKGAKQSVKLVRNADKVSNVCGDVVGDICGVLSGATSALISVNISAALGMNDITIVTMLVTAIVTSLTVLGKGFGKHLGITRADEIVTILGKAISIFSK